MDSNTNKPRDGLNDCGGAVVKITLSIDSKGQLTAVRYGGWDLVDEPQVRSVAEALHEEIVATIAQIKLERRRSTEVRS